MRTRVAILSSIGVLLAACSDTVTAPPHDTDASASRESARPGGARTRHLAGGCATTFAFTSPPGPVQQLHIDGQCAVTPLGRMTLSSEQTVVFNPDGSSTITNRSVYTTENGDQLFASFSGRGSAPTSSGVVCFSGTETYAGGTGRFVDATGSANVKGCASIPQQRGFFVARGGIRY